MHPKREGYVADALTKKVILVSALSEAILLKTRRPKGIFLRQGYLKKKNCRFLNFFVCNVTLLNCVVDMQI